MSDLELEKVKVNEQNVVLAYALWFFLGGLGVHRFYTKQSKGWLYIVLLIVGVITSFVGIGLIVYLGIFIWWIIDGIKLNQVVKVNNLQLLENYENNKKEKQVA